MKKKTKTSEPAKPALRFTPFHEFAPNDMPDHQAGTYKTLARLSNKMAVEHAASGKPMLRKDEFLKALFHRAGMQDPRRKK